MAGKVIQLTSLRGLTPPEVDEAAPTVCWKKCVCNWVVNTVFLRLLWDICREPMFILLIIACALYFILGEVTEGLMMTVTMIIVAAIPFTRK